jgi:hypothetical protein
MLPCVAVSRSNLHGLVFLSSVQELSILRSLQGWRIMWGMCCTLATALARSIDRESDKTA